MRPCGTGHSNDHTHLGLCRAQRLHFEAELDEHLEAHAVGKRVVPSRLPQQRFSANERKRESVCVKEKEQEKEGKREGERVKKGAKLTRAAASAARSNAMGASAVGASARSSAGGGASARRGNSRK